MSPRKKGLKPRLNDQTFSSNIVFVKHNVGWLNAQTMFDQTLDRVSTQNDFLRIIAEISTLFGSFGCFLPAVHGLLVGVAK